MNESRFRMPRILNPAGANWLVNAEEEVVLSRVELFGTCWVGFGTYMNRGSIRGYTEIGRYCSIGRDVSIGLGSHDHSKVSTSPFFNYPSDPSTRRLAQRTPERRVIIGNDVWIGDGVRINSGVRIGDGAIIATGAVVTKDVEPYQIVGGIPAKSLGNRFSSELSDDLLRYPWWTLDPSVLKASLPADPVQAVDWLRDEWTELQRRAPAFHSLRPDDIGR